MLLSAGFIGLFFAPSGLRPGYAERRPPSRASLLLLQLVWFAIYFDSGMAKYFGGDPSWHNGTALDQYCQNGPLPTWIAWYAQQLPHWFHAATTVLTLVVELLLVWMLFLPRRFRIACFVIVTSLQAGIILTANYAFLNYLVLSLGILLLDDRLLVKLFPKRWTRAVRDNLRGRPPTAGETPAAEEVSALLSAADGGLEQPASDAPREEPRVASQRPLLQHAGALGSIIGLWLTGFVLAWLLYADVFLVVAQVTRRAVLPAGPVTLLEPFRVANPYGLFGRMTWRRYEVEFQGSSDGRRWVAYPFRYKPQDLSEAPGIFAPYQPRFDWNLWFASLGTWRNAPWVLRCEQLLLSNDPDVIALFRRNPFAQAPPRDVRAVLWRYWFTDAAARRATGRWWRREYLGLYAPALERAPDGSLVVTAIPGPPPPPP